VGGDLELRRSVVPRFSSFVTFASLGYSVRKLFTGLEAAALKDRMLTVNSAIMAVSIPAAAKIHHCS
jgi:hypothetical protein